MTEPGNSSQFANNHSSPQAETQTMQDEADIRNSSYSKVKNFTSVETNDNITREELKSVQKSIALLKQDIRKIFHEELFKFLNQKQQQQ
ncbi:MAG TPA: hypothetical protein VLA74_07055 [Nitrososphaeraceae archaeon]|nr:hypothetical protein [Nitrososphaeraceae archaeon]